MDTDRPAPGALEEVRHLLNTDDRFHGIDHGQDVGSLNRFLARAGSAYAPLPATADLRPYRAFRDVVRDLLLRPSPSTRSAFNDVARRHPVRVEVGEHAARLRWARPSRPAAVERIVGDAVAIVHEAMLTGQWEHLRECQRDDCRWIYYDPTPTHAMRWCSTDPCGNVMKVRAYRARRAADGHHDRAL
ncbi:CGNR zinc finger domain-containing protein [Nocardioides sp. zg-1228]|uniref:CGNR zinc finger domain-containing protein n=1 Tax=Nocardioides sp. zg-1228 TaxID=2763008 RepID=UPI001642CF84|nr:CGNR zinc finger domain-containing protein [Nocardioides sp. zg-1228]MBC2931685.1 CGNR zinc finger domain-containing protein [Nocardioides sp. zg-1228]QSF57274.1 CGNR zinc finger domain-containing protein [Nocardioides sp. zg-1228]